MLYAVTLLPVRGDRAAPALRDRSLSGSPTATPYYVRKANVDAGTPNMVTAILGDYRSYDTLGEVIVVLAAGFACLLIVGRREKNEQT